MLLPNIKKKHSVVDTRPFLSVDGMDIPALGVEDIVKSLGLKLGFSGFTTKDLVESYEKQLELLAKLQHRPQQKLWGLKSWLIPGLLHSLVLSVS